MGHRDCGEQQEVTLESQGVAELGVGAMKPIEDPEHAKVLIEPTSTTEKK